MRWLPGCCLLWFLLACHSPAVIHEADGHWLRPTRSEDPIAYVRVVPEAVRLDQVESRTRPVRIKLFVENTSARPLRLLIDEVGLLDGHREPLDRLQVEPLSSFSTGDIGAGQRFGYQLSFAFPAIAHVDRASISDFVLHFPLQKGERTTHHRIEILQDWFHDSGNGDSCD